MKIATAVIKTTSEEFSGETRRIQRTSVRLAPLEVTSVATEANFIPLDMEIPLTNRDSVIEVLPVQPGFDFVKDQKLTNFKSIDLAKLKAAKHLEFVQKRFQTLAVVELPAGQVYSRDPYRQAEPYGPQIALVPIWGETDLPVGAKVSGAVELEGYAVSAQDEETGQEYFLGYRFDHEDDVNWVELVFARRKHWKSSNSLNDAEDAKNPVYSSFRFTTEDAQVIARIAQKFGRGKRNADESVTFVLPSHDAFDKCQAIEREVRELRQQAVINRDFAAQEALR